MSGRFLETDLLGDLVCPECGKTWAILDDEELEAGDHLCPSCLRFVVLSRETVGLALSRKKTFRMLECPGGFHDP